jgi:ribosomal-protein-alanine N-acetyltransferase
MDAPCRIRPVAEADLAHVAALEQRCFPDPWSMESFRAFVGGVAFLAEDPTGVLGYVFAHFAADVGEILNVAVAPEARRRGIGARLVEEACTALVRHGVDTVFLEVRESNAAAQTLYRGLGFSLVGRRRSYYRQPLEDALVLARLLADGPAPTRPSDHG